MSDASEPGIDTTPRRAASVTRDATFAVVRSARLHPGWLRAGGLGTGVGRDSRWDERRRLHGAEVRD